jgi:hypothetical protein
MAPPLCHHCSKIDFNALRGPTRAEVDNLYVGRNAAHMYGSKSDDATSRINLGTLVRIQQEASRCGLCALFAHIIERQGAIGYSKRDLKRPDVCFVATAGAVSAYYGSIGTVEPFQAFGFILQRLTVTAHDNLGAAGYGDCLAYLTHALHAQIPGSKSVPLLGKSKEAKEVSGAMLFGARQRALQLDVGLLRSWINICSSEHVDMCSARLGKDIAG